MNSDIWVMGKNVDSEKFVSKINNIPNVYHCHHRYTDYRWYYFEQIITTYVIK